jgi:hypothetical protein
MLGATVVNLVLWSTDVGKPPALKPRVQAAANPGRRRVLENVAAAWQELLTYLVTRGVEGAYALLPDLKGALAAGDAAAEYCLRLVGTKRRYMMILTCCALPREGGHVYIASGMWWHQMSRSLLGVSSAC